jgi:hypothetical protein
LPEPEAPKPPPAFVEPTTGVTLHDDALALTIQERARHVDAAKAALRDVEKTRKRTRSKDGKLRRARYVAEVLALRMTLPAEKNTPADIAKVLGTSPASVGRVLQMVRDDATLEAQIKRLDQIAMPLAVDNVIRGIINGDKGYTMKFLDGRGLFRVHKSIEAQVTERVLLFTVQMKMPAHLEGQPLPEAYRLITQKLGQDEAERFKACLLMLGWQVAKASGVLGASWGWVRSAERRAVAKLAASFSA